MKKLTVVGKGIVGALAVAHFLKYTDWDIDWVFDEKIKPSSVGEATNLKLPTRLNQVLGLTGVDLLGMNGSIKHGVYKKHWGNDCDFLHPFPLGMHAIHFSAKDLYTKIYDIVKSNRRLRIENKHVEDPAMLDSDYVMVCSGLPQELDSNTYQKRQSIPVNAAYITQCESTEPRFTYSLTNAMKHGWIFGIPLQNRLSIGYLYNKDINELKDIKDDLQNVFQEYDLIPTDKTQEILFESFSKKQNFSSNIVYNGNASFFLEPLEATSTDMAYFIIELAYNLWHHKLTATQCQEYYDAHLEQIESMISLHYLAGSKYQTEFWDTAYNSADQHIQQQFASQTSWSDFVFSAMMNEQGQGVEEYGTWSRQSYYWNIKNLNLQDKIHELWSEYNNK